MAYMHGVYQYESDTPILRPREAESAMPVYVGTFPIYRLEDPAQAVNKVFLWNSYAEAVADMGMAEPNLWADMPGAAFIDSQLRVHSIVPAAGICTWDTVVSGAVSVASVAINFVNGVATINEPMAMISTVQVATPAGCVRDKDYALRYSGNTLQLVRIDGSAILTPSTLSVTVTYKKAVIPTATAKKAAIIGGVDPATNKRKGIELIEEVWLRYQKVPGFVLAENSTDPEIYTALVAKAHNINGGNFEAIALVDLPSDSVANYRNVPEWKNKNGFNDAFAFGHWPFVGLGERIYPLSMRAAGKYGEVDADNNGRPYVQISNKTLNITKMCKPDGTELPLLSQPQANYLNENGIGTVINDGGWRFWDTETLAFPDSGDIKDTDRAVRRMFVWAKNTVNLTIKNRVDEPITKLLVDSVKHTVQGWLDSLWAENVILGARIEFLRADNERGNILSGKLYFRIFFTPPPTGRALIFNWQYDPDYLDNLWVA